MDETNFKLAQQLVSETYIQQAFQAKHQREKLVRDLLAQVVSRRSRLMFQSANYLTNLGKILILNYLYKNYLQWIPIIL
jgi:hypothetical protein